MLLQATVQHLADDPAFFAIQVSRRLPFRARVRVGELLERASRWHPGAAALGAMMAGRRETAVEALIRARMSARRSRLAGEVAVLLDRPDLLPEDAPAPTRARAAWSRGALSSAVEVLEHAGHGASSHARRLRSEIALLTPGGALVERTAPRAALNVHGPAGRPLRVLHILTNSLPHTQSGYSLRSHRILTAMRDEGIEPVALTRSGYPVMIGVVTAADEDVVDGIRYVRALPRTLPQTQEERVHHQIEVALRLVEDFRPDVLHATTNYLNALVAQAVSRITGIPWVLEVRGFMEQTWIASHGTDGGRHAAAGSEKALLIATKETQLAVDADAVVTLSRTMADELIARGVPREKISLAPNGVDRSLFQSGLDPAEARAEISLDRRLDIPAETTLVGAASALVDYEGFDTLLRALAIIIDDESSPPPLRSALHVVLVGDGAARPDLVALAAELGVTDRVHFPGRVRSDEARRWVEALDIVIIPRRDVEVTRLVTPQKPAEALALGRPVIASDLPALREALSTDKGLPSATFFAPGSAGELAAAIVHDLGAERDTAVRARTGRSIARGRSWSEMVRRYRVVYEQILAEHRGGGPDAN